MAMSNFLLTVAAVGTGFELPSRVIRRYSIVNRRET